MERRGDDLRLTRTLREGETVGVVLESVGGRSRRAPAAELARLAVPGNGGHPRSAGVRQPAAVLGIQVVGSPGDVAGGEGGRHPMPVATPTPYTVESTLLA
jgi:hypothetical protein